MAINEAARRMHQSQVLVDDDEDAIRLTLDALLRRYRSDRAGGSMTLTETVDARPQVLIADTEPAICFTLQHILHHYGYAAQAATDGAAAQTLLLHGQFDLLLIDPRLPGRVDGQNLTQIAAMHQPNAAIMLLTGTLDLAFPHDRIDARRFAALDKTASPATIATSVMRALAQRAKHLSRRYLAI